MWRHWLRTRLHRFVHLTLNQVRRRTGDIDGQGIGGEFYLADGATVSIDTATTIEDNHAISSDNNAFDYFGS